MLESNPILTAKKKKKWGKKVKGKNKTKQQKNNKNKTKKTSKVFSNDQQEC